MSETATIYVVDTDPILRDAIAEIATAFDVRSQFYDNAESFLQSYLSGDSGCVVSEFRLLGMNGISLLEELKLSGHQLPILFVTAFAETPLTVRAIQSGALTVLEKPFSRQDLWDLLKTAIDINQKTRRIDAHHTQVRRRLSRITAKEREVLDLIIAGKSNKQIANLLSVSVRTVEARRHQIFKKASAQSVAELVKIVLESGS